MSKFALKTAVLNCGFFALLLFNHLHRPSRDRVFAVVAAAAAVVAKMLFCLVIKQVNIFGPARNGQAILISSCRLCLPSFTTKKAAHTKQHHVCDVGSGYTQSIRFYVHFTAYMRETCDLCTRKTDSLAHWSS